VVDADFVRAVAAREETTNHDVAAFVDVVKSGSANRSVVDPLRAHLVGRVDTAACPRS